jgi:Zn-dependent protease
MLSGMLKSWRLGALFGFPIELHPSFLLLLALVFIAFGGAIGVALVCLTFASVVLHELGHALVARQLGVRMSGIELSFFGGAAKMVEMPRTANHELAIAAAGPAVSLMLGGAGLGLAAITHLTLFAWIGWTNLVLAGFNLIPALPMDGGRILRAALTRKLDFVRATEASIKVARVTAVAFALFGLFAGAYELLFLAPFLWILGTRELLVARMMGDGYTYDRNGYVERGYQGRTGDVEVLGRDAWDHREARAPRDAWDPGAYGAGPEPRRFTIRQRGGRLVIEEL